MPLGHAYLRKRRGHRKDFKEINHGSTEEKTKAETVAQKIDGVKSVHNLLQVVAPQHEKAMQVSDDALKQRIEQTLKADPSLKSSEITVQSVNQGVVLLGGTAETLSAHLRAVEVAAGVPGVRRVASEIQSPETLADAEIWRDSKPQPPSEGHGRGGYGQRRLDHLGHQDALAG